jgi:thioredoxin 1
MPCAKLSPVIDSVARQFAGRVKVGKVNVSEQFDLASQYGVSSIPRVLFFRGGDQPIRQLVGFVPEQELVKVVNEVFQPS